IFLSLSGLCILAQAFRLQVMDISSHRKELTKVTIPCKRGFIYDRNGEPLAITVQTPSLYACPDKIENPYVVARALHKILHISQKELVKKLNRKGEFIWIKRWLSPREAEAIEKLNLNGLGFQPENRRYYPHIFLAGQVLGFVGIDGKGLEGIERKYDYFLKGKPGYYYGIKDACGRITISPRLPIQPAQDGDTLYLTLNYKIQYAAEEALKKAIKKWHAQKGCVVVVVPQTGEILAMANYPFFDPNSFRKANPTIWRNQTIADVFEPGSTFKPFLLATALNENIWSPHDILYGEKGHYRLENVTIHDVKPFGWLSVENAIVYSSNIGAVKIGQKVKKELFYDYIKRFGFGKRTNIDLDGEASGLVRSANQWTKIDTATICFGQGIGITALQLAMAYCAIANDGKLMQPLLVREIRDAKGKVVKLYQPHIKASVITPKTAYKVKKILRKVVVKGTGQEADIPGYEVAGKTGTSQKINPKTGQYYKNKHIASFVGFFPASHPRVVIVVVIDEPHPISFGGVVAAPIFKEIAQDIIWLWQLPPSSPTFKVAKLKKTPKLAIPSKSLVEATQINPDIAQGIMPDLRGLPLRLALKILQDANIKVKIKGMGRVTRQTPPPGTKIKGDIVCLLQLEAN
ncbi:MAG: transpeptidase family protein, partial [Candidatus Desulfofervidaceae bacterium]|nr:transpeptidase family protein [Candidatus Desulfofervidaceae bacterium]